MGASSESSDAIAIADQDNMDMLEAFDILETLEYPRRGQPALHMCEFFRGVVTRLLERMRRLVQQLDPVIFAQLHQRHFEKGKAIRTCIRTGLIVIMAILA